MCYRQLFIITVVIFVLTFMSCGKKAPAEDVTCIIDSTEANLFNTKSLQEMHDMHFIMIDSITHCLDVDHNGYRFKEEADDYKEVMDRFDRYNVVFCDASSRFNPDFSINTGSKEKIVRIITLMKTMEHRAICNPKGFNPTSQTEPNDNEDQIYPTQSEIDSINAKLPVIVSEGTLLTKVAYDNSTKIQTFNYRFTQEIDETIISNGLINKLKDNMVSAISVDSNNVKRLNAGMTFLYVYYSVDNRRLYEISINSNDL